MESSAQLVFFGEILDGFAPDDVKRKLGELLRLDEARLARLFSGSRTVLKPSIGAEEAQRYVKRFAQVGARLHVEAPNAPAEMSLAPAERTAAPAAPSDTLAQAKQAREDAKLEAEREARAARLAAHRASRGLKADAPAAEAVGTPQASAFGFGFDGRIGRVAYAGGSLLMFAVVHLAAISARGPQVSRVKALFAIAVTLLAVFQLVRQTALRAHDQGRKGWWSLLMLLPLANVVLWFASWIRAGNDGDNEHGSPPAQGSWVWVAVAGVLFAGALIWRGQTAPDAPAQRQAEAAVPTTFEIVKEPTSSVLLARAAQEFSTTYAPARLHKAFAFSPTGHFGHAAGEASVADAVAAARKNCEAARVITPAAPCRIVDIDGQPVREKRG